MTTGAVAADRLLRLPVAIKTRCVTRWCCFEAGSVWHEAVGPGVIWRPWRVCLLNMTDRTVVIELRFVVNTMIKRGAAENERRLQLRDHVLVFVVRKDD